MRRKEFRPASYNPSVSSNLICGRPLGAFRLHPNAWFAGGARFGSIERVICGKAFGALRLQPTRDLWEDFWRASAPINARFAGDF
jgi:hypothetical protein